MDVSGVGHQLVVPCERVGRLQQLRGAILARLGWVGQERLRLLLQLLLLLLLTVLLHFSDQRVPLALGHAAELYSCGGQRW